LPRPICGASAGSYAAGDALIHEAYLRLVGEDMTSRIAALYWGGGACDAARAGGLRAAAQCRAPRGGLQRVEMEDNLAISPERLDEVLFLDRAMEKLKEKSPRQAQVSS